MRHPVLWGFVGVPAAIIGFLLSFVVLLTNQSCGQPVTVDTTKLPTSVGTFNSSQIANAAAIINAGATRGVTPQAQLIALIAAIGESNLQNLSGSTTPGTDAVGVFQEDSSWGTLTIRSDPTSAAASFYTALLAVPNWASLAPSIAAHDALKNADPYKYEPFIPSANAIMAAFGYAQSTCPSGSAGPAGVVDAQGWALPTAGEITSPYGPRTPVCTPVGCSSRFHKGVDISTGQAGVPIYAAHGGTVVAVGPNGTDGYWILIDDGDGISAAYAHMYVNGIFVNVGDIVTAGQNIAQVGCSGVCTGPHLYFEVRIDGVQVDPYPFMLARGVTLGG